MLVDDCLVVVARGDVDNDVNTGKGRTAAVIAELHGVFQDALTGCNTQETVDQEATRDRCGASVMALARRSASISST